MDEHHAREQYFFDPPTLDALADLLERFDSPCILCAPLLGVALADRGAAVTILDVDERFADVRGFRRWDVYRPQCLAERFDVIFCDPPFFNVSLSQLFNALRVLAHYDFGQRLIVSYLVRRGAAIRGTFQPFGLQPTGVYATYRTVPPIERNRIELFANFELHAAPPPGPPAPPTAQRR